MNEIIPGLWLGPYPSDEDASKLWIVGIRSILTLTIQPLSDTVFNRFNRKSFPILDEPTQDILEFMEEALDFIETSLAIGGVLVHCAMGISRSASFVIAFLMRKRRISYNEALDLVTQKRQIYPNTGFINQLKLFEVMGWTVSSDSAIYGHYKAMRKFLGPNYFYKNENGKSDTPNPGPSTVTGYRCRRCRYYLFNSNQVLPHAVPDTPEEKLKRSFDPLDDICGVGIEAVLIKGISVNDAPALCRRNELFTGPLPWTRSYTDLILGKIYCPGCRSKIGSYNWCGEPCPCGTWVVPAFHFIRGHLDESNHIPTPPPMCNGDKKTVDVTEDPEPSTSEEPLSDPKSD